jgi:hypothetical protein
VPGARLEPEHDLVVGVVAVVDEQPDRRPATRPGAVVVVAVGDHLAIAAHLVEGPGADQAEHHRAAGVEAAPHPGQLLAGHPGHPWRGPGRVVLGQRPGQELAGTPGGVAVEQPLVDEVGQAGAVVGNGPVGEVLRAVRGHRQAREPVVERRERHAAGTTVGGHLAVAGDGHDLVHEVVGEVESVRVWIEAGSRHRPP